MEKRDKEDKGGKEENSLAPPLSLVSPNQEFMNTESVL